MNKLDINVEHSECETVELLKIGKENEHDYNRR